MKKLIVLLSLISSVALADLIPGGAGSPASFPSGIAGKTDGVTVAAGEVGEIISASATAPGWSTSTFEMLSLSLTPGVWLLSGSAYLGASGGTRRMQMSICTGSSTCTGLVEEGTLINTDWATTNGAGSIQLSNVYVNISSAQTWYMTGLTTDITGNSSQGYYFQAVRIR